MSSRVKVSDKRRVKVVNPEEDKQSVEILAQSIVKISDGFAQLMPSGLTRKALIVLISDATSNTVGRIEIGHVLDALPRLKGYYVQPGKGN